MRKSITSFNPQSDDEAQGYLAEHYPRGRLFGKTFDSSSNIYKFVLVMAQTVKILSTQLYTLVKNIIIDSADELLTEWEESVGIPKNIRRRDTVEERRIAVRRLISKISVYNIQGRRSVNIETTYEKYIKDLTGLDVVIEMRSDETTTSSFPAKFPIEFGELLQDRRFTFIIKVDVGSEKNNTFPLKYPVVFFDPAIPEGTRTLLESVLDKIIPVYAAYEIRAL